MHILAWSLATADWGFSGFPHPLQTVGRIIPQLACDCFFPNPSRFVLQYLFPIWHYTVRASYSIATWCTIKQSQNVCESRCWGFKLFVMTHVVALFWLFVTGSTEWGWDHMAGHICQTQAIAQITFSSVMPCCSFNKVGFIHDLWNETILCWFNVFFGLKKCFYWK